MRKRLPEPVRLRILEMLDKKSSHRQIRQELGVGNNAITRVKREAGRSIQKKEPAPPSAPASEPVPGSQGGDGLTEYQPPPEKKEKKEAAPKAAPVPRTGSCGSCKARWELEDGDEEPSRCPR